MRNDQVYHHIMFFQRILKVLVFYLFEIDLHFSFYLSRIHFIVFLKAY